MPPGHPALVTNGVTPGRGRSCQATWLVAAWEDDPVGWIDLDGAANVRDLGGLPTDDGRRVADRRLLRGDNLRDLSPADVTLLVTGIGLTTIIDLRSAEEVAAAGPGPLTRVEAMQHAHHSLLPELGQKTAADMMAIRLAAAHDRYPGDVRCGLYLGYLEERPAQVMAALRGIAQASGAVMVHCAAGKDRTGVVVALALSVASVRRDAVIADYAASAERIGAVLARLRSSQTRADIDDRPDEEQTPRAETMAAFLDQVDSRYGGAGGWLSAHGFTADDANALRARLLET
jgi:protein-tyrosine phosphatase